MTLPESVFYSVCVLAVCGSVTYAVTVAYAMRKVAHIVDNTIKKLADL